MRDIGTATVEYLQLSMGTLTRGVRRFLDLSHTNGLRGAVGRLLRKPRQVLIRPAMQESARVGADLEKTVATLGRTEARVTALEDAQLATRLAVLEAHIEHQDASIRELAARAAQLEADRARLDHAVAVLELHGRSIVALADLKAASTPVPSPAPGSVLISVVIPTRNRVDDLRQALASLRSQSWPGWEALVVDDASTDGTAELLAALAAQDARIRWFTQPQQGHAAARNLALTHSRGDVVTYLDDDNEYFPDYLAAVAQAFSGDSSLEFAYAAQVWVGPGAVSRVTFDRYDWTELRDMRMSIDTNVVAHRRALFERLGGFDANLLRHADLDLALRYTAATTPRRLPIMAVRYRWDATPRVSNTMSSAAALHRIREKHATPIGRGLRVLYLTYDYPQLSESYVHAEIRWMVSRGVEVEVFAQQRPLSRGEAIVPVQYGDLAGAVARFRPDVIHVHWLSLARQYAPQLAEFGVPVTAKGHGFDHTEELAAWLLAQPWLERMYLFGNLPQAGIRGRSKVRTCGAAVDTSRYYPVARKDRNLVLRAGACLPTKDLGMFVEVAALCPEYHFTLALSSNDSGVETEQRLRTRNAELGGVVEILTDVPYEPMAALMRNAAIYLHTFGFTQPFAQPVSVVEAMASGTVPLLRQADAVRAYAGDAAMYYDTAEDAARLLRQMRQWDDARWQSAQLACVDFAYARHADTQVLEPMLHDWMAARGVRPA